MRNALSAALTCWSISAGAAAGGLHAGDIGFFVEDSTLHTGLVVDQSIVPARVFGAELALESGEVFADEPGFLCPPGELPPFSIVALDLIGPLREWNGAAFNAGSSAWIEIEFNGSVAQSSQTPGAVVPGPRFAVDAFGELHSHADHYLVNAPASGIFLLELRASNSGVSNPTAPFFLVYHFGRPDSEHDEAMEWVEANLLVPPCPADLSGDGLVNSVDLAALLGAWGPGAGPADISGDGLVNSVDLAAMLGAWGACK